jgi:2-dehydropantoate 2-reductase
MKILVVGAGAVGGYFGAGLLAAGREVTFLVRARRAEQLRRTGLVVLSRDGDLSLAAPRTVDAARLGGPYDLILLSCKAYDLGACIADFAPGMHAATLVLPLLNGMSHMDSLDDEFGSERVLGGLARISTTLDGEGRIHQMGEFRTLVFGRRGANDPERVAAVETALKVPGFSSIASGDIVREMWEKWLFIAAAAALTSLMRAPVGDIVAAGAADIAVGLIRECAAIAAENGFQPSQASIDFAVSLLTAAGSPFTASMFRDIENHARIESQQIVGDLLARSKAANPLLKVAFAHLKAYETRREREAAAGRDQAAQARANTASTMP